MILNLYCIQRNQLENAKQFHAVSTLFVPNIPLYPIAFLQVKYELDLSHVASSQDIKILTRWTEDFEIYSTTSNIKPAKQLVYSDFRTSNNSYSIWLAGRGIPSTLHSKGYHVSNCWSLPQNSFKNRFYDRYLCRYWKSWWNSFTVLRSLFVLLQPHLHKSFLKVLILEVSSFYSNFTGKRTRADLRTTNSTPNTSVSFLWLFTPWWEKP